MSHEHCEKHNRPTMNGSPDCEYEEKEAPFASQPRPWSRMSAERKASEDRAYWWVWDASGLPVCGAMSQTLADLIVSLANAGYQPRPPK